MPWLSNFPETNVRTYVRAPDGTTGVWFLSLDAARASAVVTARTTYRLPYFWSKMAVTTVGSGRVVPEPSPLARARSARRARSPSRSASRSRPAELDGLDHWLTARWRLFSVSAHGQRYARADHPPWPLHRAQVLHLHDELITATGLPHPTGDPLVHWSPGVEVRIGFPHALA